MAPPERQVPPKPLTPAEISKFCEVNRAGGVTVDEVTYLSEVVFTDPMKNGLSSYVISHDEMARLSNMLDEDKRP